MLWQAVCGALIVFHKVNKDGLSGVSYERVNGEF